MIKKLSCVAIIAFLTALSMNELLAQVKEEATKVVIIEKSEDADGHITETKIVKEGKEAEDYLNSQGGNTWISSEGDTIDLGDTVHKMVKKQAYRIKIIDEDGQEKLLEWDGQGEMPAEMKKHMDENDIKLEPGKHIKIKEKQVGEEIEIEVEVEQESDKKSAKKKVMIIKDSDGDMKEMNFEFDGDELPKELKEILEKEGIDIEELINEKGEAEVKVIKKKGSKGGSGKAQLGVNIASHPTGVRVTGLIPDSAAERAGIEIGDIITQVDDTKTLTIEDLVNKVSQHKPNDIVIMQYERSGETQSAEVVLQERVEPFEFGTWEEVMNSGKKDKVIEKEIIIEKQRK